MPDIVPTGKERVHTDDRTHEVREPRVREFMKWCVFLGSTGKEGEGGVSADILKLLTLPLSTTEVKVKEYFLQSVIIHSLGNS